MKTHPPTDRRVRRTRLRLRMALVDLILEKNYQKITVQDIIDRADVGRSTFYAHFEGKEDLLMSGFSDLAYDLERHVAATTHDSGDPAHLVHSLHFFRHASANADLYRAMVHSGARDLFLNIGMRHMQQEIEMHARGILPPEAERPVPLPVLIQFLAGALLSMLTWWIENGMAQTVEEMDAIFNRLAMPGVWQILGQEPGKNNSLSTAV